MDLKRIRCRKCGKDLKISNSIDNQCMSSIDHVLYISVESAPDWILAQVNLAKWSKGKVTCIKCGGRLGSFDFTNIKKCGLCYEHDLSAIHVLQDRVDVLEPRPQNIRLALPQINNDSLHEVFAQDNSLTTNNDTDHDLNKNTSYPSECAASNNGAESSETIDNPISNVRKSSESGRYMHKTKDSGDVLDTEKMIAVGGALADDTELDLHFFKDLEAERTSVKNDEKTLLHVSDTLVTRTDETELDPQLVKVFERERSDLQTQTSHNLGTKTLNDAFEKNNHETRGDQRRKRRRNKDECEDSYQNPYTVLQNLEDSSTKVSSELEDSDFAKDPDKKEKKNTECDAVPETVVLDDDYCAICLELYYRPHQVVPCQHRFCEPCLRQLAKGSPSTTPCPMCRHVIKRCIFDEDLDSTLKEKYKDLYKQRQHFNRKITEKYYRLPECSEQVYERAFEREIQVQRSAHVLTIVLLLYFLYVLCWWLIPMIWNIILSVDGIFEEWSKVASDYWSVKFLVYHLIKLIIHGRALWKLYYHTTYFTRWYHYLIFILHGYAVFQINLLRASLVTLTAIWISIYIVKRALERENRIQRHWLQRLRQNGRAFLDSNFFYVLATCVLWSFVLCVLYVLFWWLIPMIWNGIFSVDGIFDDWSRDASDYWSVNFHVYNLIKLIIHGVAWWKLYYHTAHFTRWYHYLIFVLHGYAAFQINIFRAALLTVTAELLSRYIIYRARNR